MKHLIKEVFRSPKFVIGFSIFVIILLTLIIYPLLVPDEPLDMIGLGTFFKPGTYVNVYDSLDSKTYQLKIEDASLNRIANKLGDEERNDIKEWLISFGISEEEIDVEDTEKLLELWENNYDPSLRFEGMTSAKRKYFVRLNDSLKNLLSIEGVIIAEKNDETGELIEDKTIPQNDYINVKEIANVRVFPLGTDNFGRDVLTELISAIGTSLKIGFVAGLIATLIGLTLGLAAGYMGGWVDNIIMFITNLFTVIPSFVLLILISYSIGQEQRGAFTVAAVIGFTSWVWTTRAVRAQVLSLRHRDHVNLSKLSGHSIAHIIIFDILPYIASYVVMAFILQISSAILAEASLSILGLGPKTTDVPTLGLMMNWAMLYSAHILGKWWAYIPVVISIALISFSLNLMNTGLDQVFNPALRD
ncbi:MAG: ABC transporter permease subunit [Chloroflexota bacterium]|nr:ABC transporter permease subunit [Chloroflexota bacterium]